MSNLYHLYKIGELPVHQQTEANKWLGQDWGDGQHKLSVSISKDLLIKEIKYHFGWKKNQLDRLQNAGTYLRDRFIKHLFNKYPSLRCAN